MTLKREGESQRTEGLDIGCYSTGVVEGGSQRTEGLDIGCYSTGVVEGESYDPEKGR